MPSAKRVAMVAALEREVRGLIKHWTRVPQQHDGHQFVFFERDDFVCVCGGIGVQAARRAAAAVIALYNPVRVQSVGFAGALKKDASLRVGHIFTPAVVLDARDGSRYQLAGGEGMLVTFMDVADAPQKTRLGQAYGAQAVDMEAAAVAQAARAHGIAFGAIKVISDEANFEIPTMARFIDAEGHFRTSSFVAFAALRPWLWKRVAELAGNASKAAKALAAHLEDVAVGQKSSEQRILDQTALDETSKDQRKSPIPPTTSLRAGGRD